MSICINLFFPIPSSLTDTWKNRMCFPKRTYIQVSDIQCRYLYLSLLNTRKLKKTEGKNPNKSNHCTKISFINTYHQSGHICNTCISNLTLSNMCQTIVIHLLDNLKKTNKKTVKQKKAEKQTKISYINC